MNDLRQELRMYASKERKNKNKYFFKTRKGEYGEDDRFLGISNPDIRKVAKIYKNLSLDELQKLIISKYNEERLCILIILVNQFGDKKITKVGQKNIYNFYIKNLQYVNNWNLVDLSAPHIMGEYLLYNKYERQIWNRLVVESSQWRRRACIVSTWTFINQNNFRYTLEYAQELLSDKEDLMHKSVGWMLREVWKRDNEICEGFLIKNYDKLPRTTLRYAIERMPEKKRKNFLQGKF